MLKALSVSCTKLTRPQRLIVLAHLTLALLYGAMIPPWEAHDETGHFAYVNDVIAKRSLPNASASAQSKVLFDQSHQPPLYYLITSALTFWIDRSDNIQPQFNNFALDGTNRRGYRIMLRQTGEAFPWTGTILALHAARVVSALLSGLAVYLVAKSANTMFGNKSSAALLSVALAAFNPQVIFMGAMVNNDVMVAATGALVAYCILRIAYRQDAGRKTQALPGVRRLSSVFLGLALGLAFLSKNSALALIGFVALALAFVAWRQRWAMRDLLGRGAVSFVAFLVVAGPYVVYNFARYGRPFIDRNPNSPILNAPTSVIGEGVFTSIRDAWLPQLFANTFRTFWGKFGWGNVQLPEWIYFVLALFCIAGVVGVVMGFRRASRELRTAIVVLLMLGASMMVLPLYRALFYQDPSLLPGRYLMPALTAYAGLLGFGWSSIIGEERWAPCDVAHRSSPLASAIVTAFALFAFVTPLAFIWPRYAPRLVTSTEAPPLLTFNDVVQVTDVSAQAASLPDREGMRQYARVRMQWRALTSTAQQYAFGVSVLGRNNEVLGTMNVFPNLGNYPSTNWQAGDTFVDEYDILLEKPCAQLPALGKVNVSVFQFEPISDTQSIRITNVLAARDGEGRDVAPVVGRFKIGAAPPMPVFWQPGLGKFDGIWLRDVRLPAQAQPGTTVTATLTYELVEPTSKQGTAFVHLFDENGKLVAQDDRPPMDGNYPTDLWDVGECVRQSFTLRIPSDARGTLRALTGFYSPSDGVRFKTGTPDDVLPIGEIKVTSDD